MIAKSRPKFSVLMCNYNYGDYISHAINSVLEQTLPDFELIIVDDGSTDHSVNEISKFSDQRIHFISQENRGQAAAFNTGIQYCSGELTAFLDSDDWWLPQKLENVNLSCQASRASIGLIQHQVTVWSDGEEWPYKHILPSGNCFEDMQSTGNLDHFVPTSGIVIPTEICKKIFPIPESLKLCADAYLTRTSIAFGSLLSIPQSLGYYRAHINAVFRNASFNSITLFNDTLIPELNRFYSENGFTDVVIRNLPEQKPHAIQLRRTFRQKVLSRIARLAQKMAEN
jgi:glycosyltransferase involved in cell wall biosynthesis